jgi:predicted negative regulator of RcsB-dependent stress response
MARKRGRIRKLVVAVVLILAAVGGYTIWKAKPTQDGISAAKKTADRAEKAAKAAERAWK